jgi:hypothetical protein
VGDIMRTKEELKSMLWDNIAVDTLLRMWEKRLIVAILPEEIEKCKFKIAQYKKE